ncbi:MAG: type III restriction endonuclease, partial [Defluviitaleaceae bacterium]|nr:type III restriction endonuclease [Defluviitaleaceae bacterium]
ENAQKTSLRSTINMLAADLKSNGGSVVACYNYTGTPYVKNQVLPEVVYAYGLRESISHDYLKDCDAVQYINVKSEGFLREVVTKFQNKYGGNTYEGLMPKLAIFAATMEEAVDEVQPAVESVLADLGIPLSSVLVNVGDAKYTKEEDIRHFNNLDIVGTEGSQKQFLILVNKGREGWNCRSLFGVALFRSPKSKIFVLQATMRCLRKITDEQQTATVFLSEENYQILNDELTKNFNMEIKDLSKSGEKNPKYPVRVLPPPRKIKLRSISHEYSLTEKGYSTPVDFSLSTLDLTKYTAKAYEKKGITSEITAKEVELISVVEPMTYSLFSLVGEISRYMNISPVLINRILNEAVDGISKVVEIVNKHNAIVGDIIIPRIFEVLFDVVKNVKSEERELTLLHEPKVGGYYEFSAKPELVVRRDDVSLKDEWRARSFHADTYCFDSRPEKECFLQYVSSGRVSEVYFTGMFTSEQGDFSVQYYDPESGRIRRYYPDFFAKMTNGTYQIIEVKGDNRIDDPIVKIKEAAAREIAAESDVEYIMYAGSVIMKNNVLEQDMSIEAQLFILDEMRATVK